MPFVYAFLGFAALIILHEAGHFVAAKAVGMRVERFSLFFGPMLLKKKWGETEYGIAAIPLGGYVKITGMNPREELAEEDELKQLHARLNEVREELETNAQDAARDEVLRTEHDALNARIRNVQSELDAIRRRAYYNQKVWKRIVVILAGPAVNLLIAFLILWGLFLANGEAVPTKRVFSVRTGTPAARVLKPGDRIVSVDGVTGPTSAIQDEIRSHRCVSAQTDGCLAGTPVRVVVRRGGHMLTFALRPRYVAKDGNMELGFGFDTGQKPVSAGRAASLTVTGLWTVTKSTVSVVARIFEPQQRKQLHGVVGGYTVTEQSFSQSPTLAFQVLALISLSLAVINLFPFLPLDGGHVFWALAEKVRGKRIPFEVMERAGVVGFALILIIFVIGLSNDISTLTGSGFNVR
ncbi:MAG TPA: M50 family metallopeptidase [Solirubrobacteraceae bacterium]|nr:M50 family metallopeptidase [Solirubrobacteraceae bacterium]